MQNQQQNKSQGGREIKPSFFGCFHKLDKYPWQRTFTINNQNEKSPFPSNFIRTSKYTLLSFLPTSIFVQFYRYANIYFLIIAILQLIPEISVMNPLTGITPLMFVIAVSMFREGFEDIGRHNQDNFENKDLLVGDLMIIKENEMIPADVILLQSSLPNGIAYIQTGSLDGEKALKPRASLMQTMQLLKGLEEFDEQGYQLPNLKFVAQKPEISFNFFEGSVEYEEKKYLLGNKQLLLRGAYLKNTKWVIAIVAYTGNDTKIMLNSGVSQVKTSNIEHITNKIIIFILILQLLLCLVAAFLNLYFSEEISHQHWYLPEVEDIWTEGMQRYFSFFLLINTMLPISLIVSLEVVKIIQAYFISQDDGLYVKAIQKRCRPVATNITEELGQIQQIFTDKTGTLV